MNTIEMTKGSTRPLDAFASGAGTSQRALPPAPRTVQDTGLPFSFLVELAVKTLFLGGQLGLTELAGRMKLSVGVIDPLIGYLRAEKLCEINRAGNTGTDADINYRLTDLGRARGAEFLTRCAYAGPAPDTLDD